MRTTAVVEMRAVDELLEELDNIRAEVIAGTVLGWGGVVRYTGDRDVCYIGGTFQTNSADRARAMLKVSAAMMRTDDYLPPPPISTSLH